MTLQDFFEDDVLENWFENAAIPNVGDAGGIQPSVGAGNFYHSLHTALVAEATNDQTNNEAAYTGYGTRPSTARAGAEWNVASGLVDNVNVIAFPASTSSETETHFGLGSAATGVGNLFMHGALTASRQVSDGSTPQYDAGEFNITID